jgi:diguanylate cyclase (GGDEF)-like protein
MSPVNERHQLSTSRLAKSIARRLRVSWREQPTQHDIEALEDNVRRVGLVIRFRWMLVGALAVFSALAALVYAFDPSIPRSALVTNMRVPAAVLLFVLCYNAYYQYTLRWLGNIAILNHAQLLFDTLVVTVLVYYSGGVYSWFYTMYPLIVLEAAFIFWRPRDTWFVAGVAAASYAFLLGLEFFRLVPHVSMPFIGSGLEHEAAYVLVRGLWTLTLMSGTALIGLQMMAGVHAREQLLSASATNDETTGLTNRTHFHQRLAAEIRRARAYGLGLSVVLLDIDDFATFNRRFGLKAGNRMLAELAVALREEACEHSDSPVADLTTVSRYGGEEFAVVQPDPPGLKRGKAAARARSLAERLRERVGSLRVDDMGVTVSVGLALFPHDGLTGEDLMSSADQAVFAAGTLGGNRVVTADDSLAEAGAIG